MTERLFRTSPFMDFPSGSMVKNQPAMQEFEETQFQSLGQEDPWRRAWQLALALALALQYPCLDIPMDRGALWAIVHGFTESDTSEAT